MGAFNPSHCLKDGVLAEGVRALLKEFFPATNSGAPYLAFFARCGKYANLNVSCRLVEKVWIGTRFPHLAKIRDMAHPSSWQGKSLRQQRAPGAKTLQGLTGGRQDHKISLPPFFQASPMLIQCHECRGIAPR